MRSAAGIFTPKSCMPATAAMNMYSIMRTVTYLRERGGVHVRWGE